MADITVYTTETRYGARILNLLDARGLDYSVVTVATEADRRALAERSGRMTCPLVFVGEELIGGISETIAADRSGRLSALATS